MPRRPEGRTAVKWQAAIDERDDRAAQAYAKKHFMAKSTVYAQALMWYLDNPSVQSEKEVLSEVERRAMERWRNERR